MNCAPDERDPGLDGARPPLHHPLDDDLEGLAVPQRPVGDDDGVVELPEGVGARGGDAVVADARVATVQVVEAELVRVVQQDLGGNSTKLEIICTKMGLKSCHRVKLK